MQRRNLLKTVGASALAGTSVATASAQGAPESEDDPRIVSYEYEHDSTDRGDQYSVEYGEDGRVEISGAIETPNPCYDCRIAGIESTPYGDVVQVRAFRNDADVCATVLSTIHYRIVLEYEYASPANVLVDQGVAGTPAPASVSSRS